jgi:cell volume regulation protein A
VHRMTISSEAPANGRRIDELADLPEDAWISLVVRDNRLLPVRGDTELLAGDQVLILADPDLQEVLGATFLGRQPDKGDQRP